jgi:hypothetical protein
LTTGDQARRTSGWEAMLRNLAADAVVAEAVLYAAGGRRLTVEHGQPLNEQAAVLVRQLVDDVDQAVAAVGYLGGGSWSGRPGSPRTGLTQASPSPAVRSAPRRSTAASRKAASPQEGSKTLSESERTAQSVT